MEVLSIIHYTTIGLAIRHDKIHPYKGLWGNTALEKGNTVRELRRLQGQHSGAKG